MVLEIGFGTGSSTLSIAAADPATGVLAADVHTPGVGNLVLALVEGVPASITCYVSDGESRMESSMTGTLREFRGRGLAGYAKAAALHRARERGMRYAYTGNHEDNAPMLAANRRLGYAPVGSETVYVRRLRG